MSSIKNCEFSFLMRVRIIVTLGTDFWEKLRFALETDLEFVRIFTNPMTLLTSENTVRRCNEYRKLQVEKRQLQRK